MRWSRLAVTAVMAVASPAGAAVVDIVTGAGSAADAACTINRTLGQGSTGAQVSCLQARLNVLGHPVGPVDGDFGPQTRDGVIRYQRANGLTVDGIVGRQTGRSLGIWADAPRACRPPAGVPSSARQVVVVNAFGSYADVDLLLRRPRGWTCARMEMAGRVGRNGVRPLAQRRSGDGTTPAGIFRLAAHRAPDGQVFQVFGNGSDPGGPAAWRQVESGDCWGATPGTSSYNRLRRSAAGACPSPDEYLPNFVGSYRQAALIGANMGRHRSGDDPGEPPLAAAIFLHHFSFDANGGTRATSGCVSLGTTNLAAVLRHLRPGRAWFVIR